jgi:hypothetical protein
VRDIVHIMSGLYKAAMMTRLGLRAPEAEMTRRLPLRVSSACLRPSPATWFELAPASRLAAMTRDTRPAEDHAPHSSELARTGGVPVPTHV